MRSVSYTHLEKGELSRSIQKTNRLIREIRAQIGKLKEWIADPVSYTHLCDKTEAVAMADLAEPDVIDPEALRLIVGATPVSYTHLDVYKRQGLRSTASPIFR